MFLYAKVVLDNLMEQVSYEDLKDELKSENFPDGLERAYDYLISLVCRYLRANSNQ